MPHHHHKGKRFENFVYGILASPSKKIVVILLILLALVGSIMMFPTEIVKARMLPGKSANTFTVYVTTPAGSSIQETKKVSECVVSVLEKEKEVTDIETYLGQGSPLDYAGLVKGSAFKQGERFSEIVVNLTDKHEREEKSFTMVHRLRPVVKNQCLPLVKGTTIAMIEQPAGPPTLASIVVEVYGGNNENVRNIAKEVANVLKNTPKLVDVEVMSETPYTRYELVPLTDKIIKSGLSVEQVNNILYLAFKGMEVAVKNTIELNDQVGIFVALSEESKALDKKSLSALKAKLDSLYLMNKKGMMIPLTEIVTLQAIESSPTIYHKDLRTMVNVIAETDIESQVYPLLDAREKMIEHFKKLGYKVEKVPGITTYMFDLKLFDKQGHEFLLRWDGEMKVTLDTFRDLGAAFIAALILIYLLLVIYYKSFGIAGIVLGGSFLSIIGVIVGHWVADLVTVDTFFLTATSLIGFIALMGISSRNSLLLIDFAKSLMEDKGIEKKRAIAIASATRAKPIMLTAIAIILGSALLASDPIFGGLGVALISGTVAAVIVSLLFVPILMDNSKAL
ncbi:MAG: efflux RND transporter permease subunit [Epsilonproteobacteria bacterium]|nr:efflux RND transporter permease subunit [Campylobacterota bacterium]